jgi:hypothetical protein
MVSSIDDGIDFAGEVFVGVVFVVFEIGVKGGDDRLGMLRVQDSIDDT